MIKSVVGAACVGLAVLASVQSASAQVGRFDPGLRTASAPLLTGVQFRDGGHGGPDLRRPGGGRPGGFGGGHGGHGFGGGAGGQRRFGGGDRGHRGGGFGVGAGIAGLAAGAIIGGAIASQASPAYGDPAYGYGYDNGYAPPPPAPVYADAEPSGDSQGYCMQRYKSYDPASGTYLGFDGLRHPCP